MKRVKVSCLFGEIHLGMKYNGNSLRLQHTAVGHQRKFGSLCVYSMSNSYCYWSSKFWFTSRLNTNNESLNRFPVRLSWSSKQHASLTRSWLQGNDTPWPEITARTDVLSRFHSGLLVYVSSISSLCLCWFHCTHCMLLPPTDLCRSQLKFKSIRFLCGPGSRLNYDYCLNQPSTSVV